MRLELTRGAIVYEGKRGLVRRYETNWDAAIRSVMDQLSWAASHKQKCPLLTVVDIESGRLVIYEDSELIE